MLLRWVEPEHGGYPVVISAMDAIVRQGGVVCYPSQSVAARSVLRSRRLMTGLVVDPILTSGLRDELMILGRLHM